MTKIICHFFECTHNSIGHCQQKEIILEKDFEDHTSLVCKSYDFDEKKRIYRKGGMKDEKVFAGRQGKNS